MAESPKSKRRADDYTRNREENFMQTLGDDYLNPYRQVHDEGVQIVENLANIRVPMIAAVEAARSFGSRPRAIHASQELTCRMRNQEENTCHE
jgi:hypothetical protein